MNVKKNKKLRGGMIEEIKKASLIWMATVIIIYLKIVAPILSALCLVCVGYLTVLILTEPISPILVYELFVGMCFTSVVILIVVLGHIFVPWEIPRWIEEMGEKNET